MEMSYRCFASPTCRRDQILHTHPRARSPAGQRTPHTVCIYTTATTVLAHLRLVGTPLRQVLASQLVVVFRQVWAVCILPSHGHGEKEARPYPRECYRTKKQAEARALPAVWTAVHRPEVRTFLEPLLDRDGLFIPRTKCGALRATQLAHDMY